MNLSRLITCCTKIAVTGIKLDGNTEFGSSFSFTNSRFITNLSKPLTGLHSNIVLNSPVVNAGTEIFINNCNRGKCF